MNNRANTADSNIVIIGLGYVGLTLAVHLSNLGFRVHGVEMRESVLKSLGQNRSFFWEPNIDEIIRHTVESGKFTFSSTIPESTENRVFIITVGTPLNAAREVNLEPISRATRQVSHSLKDGDLVILRSTVKIGTTQTLVANLLKSKNCNFDLAFCPERTLEGDALNELQSLPQIIGADSEQSAERAIKFFSKSTQTVVRVSNSRTAEIIKLVDNMQRDAKFAISNEIAAMCNEVDIRATEVISLGKLGYSRTNLASPGPVGGPCLEKDSYILAESFLKSSLGNLTLTARQTNENVVSLGCQFILKHFSDLSIRQLSKVAILGLAFKGVPETDDLRGSPSINLINELKNGINCIEIVGWDPMINELDLEYSYFRLAQSLDEAVNGADAVILANNHPIFSSLDLLALSKTLRGGALIYDFWDRYSDTNLESNNACYFGWGNHKTQLVETIN